MLRKGMFLADRYEIIEQIGSGGMSDVYKAKCHKLNRFVAVKVMKSEFNEDKTFVSKFRAEAQAVAGFTHPNVVNVYDVGDEDGVYYIIMELVEGITLKKYIEKRGKIPFKEAVSIAIQVANGLDAAHKHHIVHRDIKPQNIIISKEGKVKVTDFGIAKVASTSTINSSSTMGSVHYISPEQARRNYSDERSDIYSLGITMFEMLAGVVPFDGDSTVSVALRHIQDEIPALSDVTSDIPISIERIVAKCTQKKPERRYQSAGELITDLKKALVMPDTDFVVMAPAYMASGNAASASINADAPMRSDRDDDGDEFFANMSGEESEEEDAEYEGGEDESPEDDGYSVSDDIDDESNDKLDLIMKVIGIGIAVIILVVTIFIVVKLLGSTSSSSSSTTTAAESTASVTGTTEDDTDKVTVPSVEGLTKEEAIKALNAEGLGYKAVIQNSDTVDKDRVISQGTKAGTKVSKNTQIILTISGGAEVTNVTVPSVSGMTEDEAREALEDAGFIVDVDYEYSSTVDSGNVIKASPSGAVSEGSTITITVSRGKEITYVTMTNLIGMSESAARQWLEANDLVPNVKYESSSGTYGLIIQCDYAAGTSVATGTTVTIYVSTKQSGTSSSNETSTSSTEESSSETESTSTTN